MDFVEPAADPAATDTAREIAQQPMLWGELADLLQQARPRLEAFLGDALRDPRQQVLFTGAGSSGFIADMVADTVGQQWPAECRAVHTTSLLTHPASYLDAQRPTLLVSFARERLAAGVARDLELICANPDRVVQRGDQIMRQQITGFFAGYDCQLERTLSRHDGPPGGKPTTNRPSVSARAISRRACR